MVVLKNKVDQLASAPSPVQPVDPTSVVQAFDGMFSLLLREHEPKPWAPGPAVTIELKQYKYPKVEWNWDNWLSS